MDPCEILTVEDLAEYGEFQSRYKEGQADRSCLWQAGARGGGYAFTFGLSLRDAQSVETVNDNGAGVQRTEVNQRPAAVAKNPGVGSCVVAMKLDDVSRIDVSVPRAEEGDACEIATALAGLVEPRLPDVPS